MKKVILFCLYFVSFGFSAFANDNSPQIIQQKLYLSSEIMMESGIGSNTSYFVGTCIQGSSRCGVLIGACGSTSAEAVANWRATQDVVCTVLSIPNAPHGSGNSE